MEIFAFDTIQIARLVAIALTSFVVAFIAMPILITLLQKMGFGKTIRDDGTTPVMSKLHKGKAGIPSMGGIVIWGTILFLILTYRAACFFEIDTLCNLSFLSRAETRLPLGILVGAGLVGLLDDYLNARKIGPKSGGLRMRWRLVSYTIIALIGAWWFYSRLGWDFVHLPFVGTFHIGLWFVPFFVFIVVATSFSVNEIDGLDGLAGGTLMMAFAAMAIISMAQGRLFLAAFCVAVLGALLAFLWFNIPPASIFMGDTGAMALGTTLAAVAIITNTALLLPMIGLLFVVESLSVIIQVFWKKVFGRKLLKSSPLHHHLEAIGWPEQQIVMRAWIISIMVAAMGVIFALVDHTLL